MSSIEIPRDPNVIESKIFNNSDEIINQGKSLANLKAEFEWLESIMSNGKALKII